MLSEKIYKGYSTEKPKLSARGAWHVPVGHLSLNFTHLKLCLNNNGKLFLKISAFSEIVYKTFT